MTHLAAFLAGVLVTCAIAIGQDIRREYHRPMPPAQAEPARVVRMVDLTMPPLDRNTTNRRQRFSCEPTP
jgi:hypothetical protein